MQRYRRENGEKDLAAYRRRYAKNPEPFLESVHAWQAANPDKRREYGRNRLRRE
jgi:hypothetical protein